MGAACLSGDPLDCKATTRQCGENAESDMQHDSLQIDSDRQVSQVASGRAECLSVAHHNHNEHLVNRGLPVSLAAVFVMRLLARRFWSAAACALLFVRNVLIRECVPTFWWGLHTPAVHTRSDGDLTSRTSRAVEPAESGDAWAATVKLPHSCLLLIVHPKPAASVQLPARSSAVCCTVSLGRSWR